MGIHVTNERGGLALHGIGREWFIAGARSLGFCTEIVAKRGGNATYSGVGDPVENLTPTVFLSRWLVRLISACAVSRRKLWEALRDHCPG